MNELGWPFLVGCNRQLDYRAIVAPERLVISKETRDLADALGSDSGAQGDLLYRNVELPRSGSVHLVFRVIPAAPDLVGESGPVLRDDWGRPIYLIEGLLLLSAEARERVKPEDLQALHDQLAATFREFWPSATWTPKAAGPVLRSPDGGVEPLCFRDSTCEPGPSKARKTATPEPILPEPASLLDASGHQLAPAARDPVVDLTYSMDGRCLIARTLGQELMAWEVPSKRLWRWTPLGPGMIQSRCTMAFNDREPFEVITGVRLNGTWSLLSYSLATDTSVRLVDLPFAPHLVVSSSPSRYFYICGETQTRIYQLADSFWARPRWTFQGRLDQGFSAVCHSKTGIVQTGERNGRLQVFRDGLDGKASETWQHSTGITHLASTYEGGILISADERHEVWLWDWRRPTGRLLYSHAARIVGLAASSDGEMVVSGDVDGRIILWNLKTWTQSEMWLEERSLCSLALSPRGRMLAVASDSGTIQLIPPSQ